MSNNKPTRTMHVGADTQILVGISLDEQVERVLADAVLEPRDKDVLRILDAHRGQANPIKGEDILKQLDVAVDEHSRRWLKNVVENLVTTHGVKIGGSRFKPYGYFLVTSLADLDVALSPLLGEWYAYGRRIRALTSKTDFMRLCGQLDLDFDAAQQSLTLVAGPEQPPAEPERVQ